MGDAATALAAGVAGLAAPTPSGPGTAPVVGALLLALLVVGWGVALLLSDGYARRGLAVAGPQVRSVVRAVVGIVAAVALLAYLWDVRVPRDRFAVVVAALLVGGLGTRLLVLRWLRRARARGRLLQRTVVVGRCDAVADLVRSLHAGPEQGLLPVGVCASALDGPVAHGAEIADVPVLGDPACAVEAVDLCDAEVVAVSAHPDLAGPTLRRLAWALEERNVELVVAPGLLDVAGPRLWVRPSSDLSLLHVEWPGAVRLHLLGKALFDRVLASALLVALAPLLVVVAVLVWAGDRGPVFFRQERVGVRGRVFSMLKFRTMVVGADRILADLDGVGQGNGVLFKMHRDPRVTRVGRTLRRFSLDELPQLVNVVRGKMSLVGPRPPLPREVARYEADAMHRLNVRPGLTGLWQVSGRSDLSWEESLRLDLHYLDNWSPFVDLQVLLRTVDAVVRGRGAY